MVFKRELEKQIAELEKDKAYAEEQLDEQIQATLKLQKENAELEQKLEQTEKDLTDYQFNYPKIKELEKENAELKALLGCKNCSELLEEECEVCAEASHFKCEGKTQLAKAKEIIKELIKYDIPTLDYEKAEQFLKEIEK